MSGFPRPVNAVELQGIPISATAPTNGDALVYDSTTDEYSPAASSGNGFTKVATTGATGFALQNGTPTILDWTAPNDGNIHRVVVVSYEAVTSSTTGGQVELQILNPSIVVEQGIVIYPASPVQYQYINPAFPNSLLVPAAYIVKIGQTSALTAGAATVYAEIWAA